MRYLFAALSTSALLAHAALIPSRALAQSSSTRPGEGFDEKVIDRLKKILEVAPEEGFVLDQLLKSYRTYKTAAELISEYEAKAAASPASASFQLVLGLLYKAEGRPKDAERAFTQAKTLDPKNPKAPLALASLREAENDPAGAKALYEEALAATSDKISKREILRRLVSLSVAQGAVSQAREFAKALAKSDPGNLYLALELPQALTRAGFHQEAIAELESLLKAAEDGKAKVQLLREIGATHEAAGELSKARTAYETALGMTTKGNSARAELRERLVAIYRQEDDLRAYIALVEKEGGKGFDEWELLGRLYEEIAESDAAIKALEKALSVGPKHLEVRERLIRIYERLGRPDDVIAQYRALMKAAPGDPRWPVALAELLAKRDQKEEARKLLDEMRKRYASDPSVRTALADLYSRFSAHEEALKEHEALVKLEPKEEAHLISLGEAYWQLDRKDEARATWKKLLTVIPEEARANALYGETLADHAEYEEAVKAYQRALALAPDELSYQKGLAQAYQKAGQQSLAFDAWAAILRSPSANALERREARERIVSLYRERGELAARIDEAKRDFAASPPDPEQGRFLVVAYLQQGKEEPAIEALKQLVSMDASDVEALRDLATLYGKLQRIEEALPVLEALAKLEPSRSREYFQQLSEYLTRLRRDKEALAYAEKALSLGPSDAAGFVRLGEIYRQQGKLTEAVRAYEQAISLDRRSFESFFKLADLYVSQGQLKEAEALLRQIIKRASIEAQISLAVSRDLALAEALGVLPSLERDLLELYRMPQARKEHRRALVDLYIRMTKPLRGVDGAVSAEAKRQLREIGDRALAPLSDVLSDPMDEQRRAVIDLVGYLQHPNGVLPLAGVLADKDSSVQLAAVLSLGRLGDKGAAGPLGGALAPANKDASLRAAAAWALGEIGAASGSTYLLKEGQGLTDAFEKVRGFSALSLARLGDQSAIPALVRRLNEDPSAEVRRAAALALGLLKAKEAIPSLSDALRPGTPVDVRVAALRALSAIGEESSLPLLLGALWDPELRAEEILSGFGAPLRMPGTWTLSARVTRRDARSLESSVSLSGYLAESVKSGTPASDVSDLLLRSEEAISSSLRDAFTERGRRLRTLALLDASRDGLALGRVLQGTDGAALLARALEPQRAVILGLLKDSDPETALRALSVSTKAGWEEAAAPGALLARSALLSPAAQGMVLRALGRLQGEEALAVLREAGKSTDPLRRADAVQALGENRAPGREAALLKALQDDPEPLVRVAALEGLERLGASESAREALTQSARAKNANIRASTARALATARFEGARELLTALAADPDPVVALAAKEALQP